MSNVPADLIRVHCPCGTKLKVRPNAIGRKAKCPKCQQIFVIAKDVTEETISIDSDDIQNSLLSELAAQENNLSAIPKNINVESHKDCPKCGESMAAQAVLCVSCGFNLQSGQTLKGTSARKSAMADKVRKLASGAGTYLLGCLLSGIGVLIGAGIWFAIAVFWQVEIGLIAWGLGALAGLGMHLGYRKQNIRAGVTAAGISLVGIFSAKLMMFLFFIFAISTGNTNDIVLQREFVKVSLVNKHLDDQEIWSEDERVEKWESVYVDVDREVENMSDEAITSKWEEFRAQQEQYVFDQEDMGPGCFRLTAHIAERRAEHMGLNYDDERRYELSQEEQENCKKLDEKQLAEKIAELDQWEKDGRWSDQEYVRDRLIYQLISEKSENDPALKDVDIWDISTSLWNNIYQPLAEQVDLMAPDQRLQQLRDIEVADENESKRMRLVYHQVSLQGMEEGLSYNDPKRQELDKEFDTKLSLLNSEELDQAIHKLDEWEKSGKLVDYDYLRNSLIYVHIDIMIFKKRSQHDFAVEDVNLPDSEEWEAMYSDAFGLVVDTPDNTLASQLEQMNLEQEKLQDLYMDKLIQEESQEMAGVAALLFFTTMFSPFDALFILFAIGTAYKIATGAEKE